MNDKGSESTSTNGCWLLKCVLDETSRALTRERSFFAINRIETCIDVLEHTTIDIYTVRAVCSKGLPDNCPALRAVYWMLVLGVLPTNKKDWDKTLSDMRQKYTDHVTVFVQEPQVIKRIRTQTLNREKRLDGESPSPVINEKIEDLPDHVSAVLNSKYFASPLFISQPLNSSESSQWKIFWEDSAIFDEINKDVFRTRPDLAFFNTQPSSLFNAPPSIDLEETKQKLSHSHNHRRDWKGHKKKDKPVQGLSAYKSEEGIRTHDYSLDDKTGSKKVKEGKGNTRRGSKTYTNLLTQPPRSYGHQNAVGHSAPPDINLSSSQPSLPMERDQRPRRSWKWKKIFSKKRSHSLAAPHMPASEPEQCAEPPYNLSKTTRRRLSVVSSPKSEPKIKKFWKTPKLPNNGSRKGSRTDSFAEPTTINHSADEQTSTQVGQTSPSAEPSISNIENPKTHYDIICRILFIYAKLHTSIKYIQGMNELLAPLYYSVFQRLKTTGTVSDDNLFQAEADVYFCFEHLMLKQKAAFCRELDYNEQGIWDRIERFSILLKTKDRTLWNHFQRLGVDPHFYALRWILLLLAQEFPIADIRVLWDAILADNTMAFPLIYYICVAILLKLRPALVAGDFTSCMNLLQNLPAFDPQTLLSLAHSMRADDLALGCLPYQLMRNPNSQENTKSDDLVAPDILAKKPHVREKMDYKDNELKNKNYQNVTGLHTLDTLDPLKELNNERKIEVLRRARAEKSKTRLDPSVLNFEGNQIIGKLSSSKEIISPDTERKPKGSMMCNISDFCESSETCLTTTTLHPLEQLNDQLMQEATKKRWHPADQGNF